MDKLKPNHPDSYRDYSGHLIKEIPILFQTEMVKANLADMKTQTRREIKDQMLQENKDQELEEFLLTTLLKCRFGKPGDLLYVRENWMKIEAKIYFQSDEAEDEIKETYDLNKLRWKPSIHLPKAFSRLWVMVEGIRVERLQDITEEDAKSEGIEPVLNGFKNYIRSLPLYWQNPRPAYNSFASLWKSINGEDSWKENPWVWVIKYRILSKTGRPSDEVILQNHLEITGDKYPLTN